LARLQENADAVLIFQNENIMRTLSKLVTMKTAAIGPKDQHALNMAHTITMKNLNESIVTVMKHIL
jgi:cell division GTPase FtsZ